MKHHISTQIEIKASPESIWSILTAFDQYPDWNPLITSISGEAVKGARLHANILSTNFKPTVIDAVPNQKFSWLGTLGFKGLFDGHHKFELIPQSGGSTLFIQSEDFSGILVRVFKQMLDTKTLAGFEAMNVALKERAEAK